MNQLPAVKFKNIDQVNQYLSRFIPKVRDVTGKDITLERMRPMMQQLGNPQERLKIIHVAGTSGKTSTAYFIARMLQKPGEKIGLTVSPHVTSVTERVQINSKPVSEQEFCQALGNFSDLITEFEPSYFELLVAFAYWYFERVGVRYAVIETGLGGSFDGTNIAQNEDKLCVITDIGLDHTAILGDTLSQISSQKAGIIHHKNDAVMYEQSSEITDVFLRRVGTVGAHIHVQHQDDLASTYNDMQFEKLPLYQQRNWLLAREACALIAARDDYELDQGHMAATVDLQVPGRMEEIRIGKKTIVFDVAHNEQKAKAFAASFTQRFGDQKAALLLAVRQGKDHLKMLEAIQPFCQSLIVTTYDASQDLPIPSMAATDLGRDAQRLGFRDVAEVQDTREACRQLLQLPNDVLVVTGSLFLVSFVKRYIKELQ